MHLFTIAIGWTTQLFFFSSVLAIPEKDNCDWVDEGTTAVMQDTSNCRNYYYCIKGKKPHRHRCPEEKNIGVILYFNPTINDCDVLENAPEKCHEADKHTTPPQTRLPVLNEKNPFEIDCSEKFCGVFPNTYGKNDTYVFCANGEKQIKSCNGGQLFDVKQMKCQPADQAAIWEEKTAPPHTWTKGKSLKPFHGKTGSTPIEEDKEKGFSVLENPIINNEGDWQDWKECPKGMYANGLYVWRRVLWANKRKKEDYVGVFTISFKCNMPGGNESSDTHIVSTAPNAPNEEWPTYYKCDGPMIGIQLNSKEDRPEDKDTIATDNVKGYCTNLDTVYKPYNESIEKNKAEQYGDRGIWTEVRFCGKMQAVCGMQTQMMDYMEKDFDYDNSGLNSMRIKCCNVEDPLTTCVPQEMRIKIRDCDNSNSNEHIRCDWESRQGLTLDNEKEQDTLDWLSSIGYEFPIKKGEKTSKIINKLADRIRTGETLEYTWTDISQSTTSDHTVLTKTLFIKPMRKVELFQIVAKCSFLIIRTNRFVRIAKDPSGKVLVETFFEI